MALLRRFFKNSYTIYVKPSYRFKSLAALHTHGSNAPQGLNPLLPWLLNPPELDSNSQRTILDLLKKSQALGLSVPVVDNFSQHCGGEAAFSKLLEQCCATQKLLEGSEAKALQGFVLKALQGFVLKALEVSGNEEGVKIWADSVKKKRRKKMNKHKYKKLRKRLRRKTKK